MNFCINRRSVYIVSCIIACMICISCVYRFIYAQRSLEKNSTVPFDWSSLVGKRNVVPMAIIGSGPAGLSAALYGGRAGIKTVVFEGDEPGGLLTETGCVENWPGVSHVQGPAVMKQLRKQACNFGAQCIPDIIEKVDFSRWPYLLYTVRGETIYALSVIIATGASPCNLGVEGEKEYWRGGGVSACARCDAPCYKDKEVIVVGGGDSAVEEALQLAPYAKKITIVHRRDQLRAASHVQEHLKDYGNIGIHYNTCVKKIIGDGNEVTAVELIDSRTQTTSLLPINGVFLAIGRKPNTALFKDYIATDEQGYIVLEGRSQVTNVPGVFAAGDVADPHYRQAGSATGDGIKSGIDATNFLHKIGYTGCRVRELADQMLDVP